MNVTHNIDTIRYITKVKRVYSEYDTFATPWRWRIQCHAPCVTTTPLVFSMVFPFSLPFSRGGRGNDDPFEERCFSGMGQ